MGYLSLEGMVAATQMDPQGFCLACFNGHYPVELASDFSKTCFESGQQSQSVGG